MQRRTISGSRKSGGDDAATTPTGQAEEHAVFSMG
jgi:hypothetical protein